MSDIIFYSTFPVTFGFNVLIFVIARSAIGRGKDKKSCENWFVLGAISAGVLSGVPFFYGMIWFIRTVGHPVSLGHGEVLLAAPLFNLLLSLALALVGRLLLQWKTVRW